MWDTDDTEAALIAGTNWTSCGLTRQAMKDSFGLHDNDLASHVFLPYFLSMLIGPWPSIVLAYLYESTATLEKIYDVRVLHPSDSFTGMVDGMLQDPAAAFIGAFTLVCHAYLFGGLKKVRRDFLAPYGLGWGREHRRANAAFLVFTLLPLFQFHKLGMDDEEWPFRVWTMCLNWVVPLAHATYVGSTSTDGFTCIGMTYLILLMASLASYIGAKEDAGDPLQSTFFWICLVLDLDGLVLWYRKRKGHKFTLLR